MKPSAGGNGKRAFFFLGIAIAVAGLLLLLSVVFQPGDRDAPRDPAVANENNRSGPRAFGGLVLIVVGGLMARIAARGFGGSGLLIDPEIARNEIEVTDEQLMGIPESKKSQRVVVLGASNKPDRYSNQAVKLLREHGHQVVPVHPALSEIEGLEVVSSIEAVEGPVDTLTVYVNPAIAEKLTDAIIAMKPGRVIFNPGSEAPTLAASLTEAGIPVEEACTLVLLRTGQFA